MKVKFISGTFSEDQKKYFNIVNSKGPDYSSYFTIGKVYVVLGVTYDSNPDSYSITLIDLRDDIGNCTSIPICLTEIIDPRPSIFWRGKIIENDLVLWPTEFYREFFHDDLSEEKPEIRKVFDIVVDRLTYEFDDATQGLPDPLAWPFEEYK